MGKSRQEALNRRKEERAVKKLYVRLNAGSIASWGLLGDLSENGLFISSVRGFPIGSEIDIEIFMPDHNSSFVKGIVRRRVELPDCHRKNGLGIELTRKDSRYVKFIVSEELEASVGQDMMV